MRKITHRNHICILPLKKEFRGAWLVDWTCDLCFRQWVYEHGRGWRMVRHQKEIRIRAPREWNRYILTMQVNYLNNDQDSFTKFVWGDGFGIYAGTA